MLFWQRTPVSPSVTGWPLSERLLSLSPLSALSVGDVVENIQILGSPGSSKTTGSLARLVMAMAEARFGGLFLTAKPGDAKQIVDWLDRAGRSSDVVVVTSQGQWRFNILDHELRTSGDAGTENLVALFATLIELGQRKNASGSRGEEPFWEQVRDRVLRTGIDLLRYAMGEVSVGALFKFVVALSDCRGDAPSPLLAQALAAARSRADSPAVHADLDLVEDFITAEFPSWSDRTRSSAIAVVTTFLDQFNRSPLRELFCTETTLTPEEAFEGKLIVLDLPIRQYHELGRIAQVAWKYAFQRAVERRSVGMETRPVMLVCDEAHLTLTRHDHDFLTTSRAARCATVCVTQNINNYYAALGGGDAARSQVDSLLGNIGSFFFHANTDAVTNQWAAERIGKRRRYFRSSSVTTPPTDYSGRVFGNANSTTAGGSEQLDYIVAPIDFVDLAKGGERFGFCAEAIVFQGGRRWAETDEAYLKAIIPQV